MHEIAKLARTKLFIRELFALIFYVTCAFPLLFVFWLYLSGELNSSTSTSGIIALVVFCLILSVFFLRFALAALSLMIFGAFDRHCHFFGGPDGIDIAMPGTSRLGLYRRAEHRVGLTEISKIVHFTYRTNGIPTHVELRIELSGGGMIRVPQRYFNPSTERIQGQILHFINSQAII